VAHEVWSLYAWTVAHIGRRPTLIEWDSALPTLHTLLGEAMWADLLASSVSFAATAEKPRARDNLPSEAVPFALPFPATIHATNEMSHV